MNDPGPHGPDFEGEWDIAMGERPLQWNNVRIVPIVHNMAEFAMEVRRQADAFDPDHVAVEYPDTLSHRIVQGVRRLPLLSVVHYREADGSFVYLVLEPTDGQVEAVRLGLERKIPLHFIDRDTEGYPIDPSPMPDSYALARIGLRKYYEAYVLTRGGEGASREDVLREKTMAFHLQRLNAGGGRILFVGGLAHVPSLMEQLEIPQTRVIGRRTREGVNLAHLHRESSREILNEMPCLAAAYERARGASPALCLDRLRVNSGLIADAEERYRKHSREELSPAMRTVMNTFATNYAYLTGRLVPSFYQLIVAARGVADDNFAYELWDLGSTYPWQTDRPDLPVLRLTGGDVLLGSRKIRLHRRIKGLRRRLVPVPVRGRPREPYPGQWKESFTGYSICSYPPEDVAVEGYGRYLQEKALTIKAKEHLRIEPFVCSMQDGLDLRETIRQRAVTGTFYVRVERPLGGKVGAVVVIFDEDRSDSRGKEAFPWCVTWLGEHAQESDMAFYSTPAGEVMDGPGISRCVYGGFMLTYPPLRVYDLWKDPFFDAARTKPERLLMGALDYSMESHVVYVAADPPSGWCKSMAARLGKKIIYLPIGTLSPVMVKKIRQFHVLDGHPVRRYASRYIR